MDKYYLYQKYKSIANVFQRSVKDRELAHDPYGLYGDCTDRGMNCWPILPIKQRFIRLPTALTNRDNREVYSLSGSEVDSRSVSY